MRVLVSGSHGWIGSGLVRRMRSRGDTVIRLVRPGSREAGDAVSWDPLSGSIDLPGLESLDAVVHLAGERIAGLWTRGKRDRIRGSRIRGTRLLCESLAACARRPRVIACASGIGYYGSRGDAILDEEQPPGTDFLARVCKEWEEVTRPASDRGIRVVNMRTALVLSPTGGFLSRLRTPFRLGFGVTLGDGTQYMSWITLEDLMSAYLFAIGDGSLAGAVNAAAPGPVTNRVFTQSLARALGRSARLRVPAWVLRGAFGEMADTLFLSSQRAVPARLQRAGFRFSGTDLDSALDGMLR